MGFFKLNLVDVMYFNGLLAPQTATCIFSDIVTGEGYDLACILFSPFLGIFLGFAYVFYI